ncbi:MAG: 3-hydroxy-3-methylglutaryl-CoA reductase, partial [Chloroflexota bacterium]|nr:3-hydroxy-3-methylglutaryl-CoA reductase [Chloroflexota bacterium]
MTNSRIAGFYKMTLEERRLKLAESADLTPEDLIPFTSGLPVDIALHMVENVIGTFDLPLGIGLNFMINGRDVLVPMVIEEPSVVAGASFMAKLARAGGGFLASSTEPHMLGQLQVLQIDDLKKAAQAVLAHKAELIAYADEAESSLKSRGGGARDIEVRVMNNSPISGFLIIHLIYDVRDAMGANAVNTACERLAPRIESITGGKVHLRILSNLADRRITRASCTIPLKELAFSAQNGSETREFTGEEVRDGIIAAYAFAAVDPYRAATHNKG